MVDDTSTPINSSISRGLMLAAILACGAIAICFGIGLVSVFKNAPSLLVVFCGCVISAALQLIAIRDLRGGGARAKRTVTLAAIFAALFCGAMVVGRAVYSYGTIEAIPKSFESVPIALSFFVGSTGTLTAAVVLSWLLFGRFAGYLFSGERHYSRRRRIALTTSLGLVIFIAWMPWYLAYFPGTFSYDIAWQTIYVFSGEWSSHHPPLHTALWAACLAIGSSLGIEPLVLYSIMQMMFLAICCAGFIVFAASKGSRLGLTLCFLAFFMNPVVALFSFQPTKDAVLGGFFLLLLVKMLQCIDAQGPVPTKSWVTIGVLSLICCLLRNNFIYALIPSAILCLLLARSERKGIVATSCAIIGLYALVTFCVYPIMGISKGSSVEALSVPDAQMSSAIVRHYDDLPPDARAKASNWVDVPLLKDSYNPRFADPTKAAFEQISQNTGAFLSLYCDLGARYPVDYIDGFLQLNIPYWYIGASAVDPLAQRAYIETHIRQTDLNPWYNIERDSKLPVLYEWAELVASHEIIDSCPAISWIFSLSTPFWLVLFCAAGLIAGRDKRALALVLPILFLCTFLLGPVSNFRYIFPVFLSYPLFVFLLASSKEGSGQRNCR